MKIIKNSNTISYVLKSILVCLVAYLFIGCQHQKEIRVETTYQELIEPSPKEYVDDWSKVSNGLHASIASTNIRFVKGRIPKIEQKNHWSSSAWKGERLSAQLVLWSVDSVTNVSTHISDFISKSGKKLPSNIAKARFVKYTIVDEWEGKCSFRDTIKSAKYLASDVLDNVSSYTIREKATRPLWITINIPQDAQEGTYSSTLTINVQNQKPKTFEFSVTVIPQTLPKGTDWKFHLDLWQNPYAVARFNKVKPWSEAHWKLLKPVMKELAEAGQKSITVSLNKRPWGGQTYDAFESMIGWTKKRNGSWKFDYSIFDDWVKFMMDLGVKKQINCYSMIPWGSEFYYFDEIENKEVKIKAAPDSKEFRELFIPFLIDFQKHLKNKGWNNMIRIAMDERQPEQMRTILNLLEEYAPEFGVALADSHKSYRLFPDQLKDLSVAFGAVIDDEDIVYRKKNGYISTFYVCCTDSFPNVFTFSPPAEAVFLGWYATAARFDGMLRWAYNSWVENPLLDSRFVRFPSGDTSIIYPGGRSSIRFETMREGIQDSEKIRILRELFVANNDNKKLAELNDLVATFNFTEQPEDLEGMLEAAKNKLNQLSKN